MRRAKSMRARRALFGAVLATLVLGCGSGTGSTALQQAPEEGAAQVVSSMNDLELFLVKPPIEVRHSGVRKVEVFDVVGRLAQAHREEVICDGQSSFSLEPLEALTAVAPDWELRQRARAGFFFRYRDFEIRSAVKFRRNYSVTETSSSETLIGRNCKLFTVSGRGPNPSNYRVWVDSATSLILKFEKLDSSGNLRFSSTYESIDTNPDLSTAVWYQNSNNEQALGLALPLVNQASESIPYPRLLPASFALYESFSLTIASELYYKQTYTDGVEPLFFLFQPSGITSTVPGKKNLREAPTKPTGAPESVLNVFEMGTSRVAQTTLEEGTYCAVGSVDSQVLIDMIESALQP